MFCTKLATETRLLSVSFPVSARGVGSYPGAVIGHAVAAGQAGIEVGDAVGAADRSVLVDFTTAVHIAAAGQVPLGHGQRGSGETSTK